MKRPISLFLLGSVLCVAGAASADTVSGRVDLGSDAFFRGFRQNNGPSFDARGDYGLGGGLYLGGAVANDRSVGDARVDLHAGVGRALQLAGYVPYRVDGGVSGSVFSGGRRGPFGRDPDYVEAYGSLALGPVSANVAASPDYFGTGGAGYRLGGSLRMPVLPLLALSVQGAWNSGEGVSRYIAVRTGGAHARNYFDYGATLSLTLPRSFSVYAQAVATNLSGARLPRGLVGVRMDFGL